MSKPQSEPPCRPTVIDNLVVIACAPRSGSTLLLRILNSHSKVAAPCEIPLVYLFDADDRNTPRLQEKFSSICEYYGMSTDQTSDSPELLLNLIKIQESKPIIVVKHPHQSIYLHKIIEHLNPKIIYLTRDVRSTAMTSFYSKDRARGFSRWMEIHSSIIKSLPAIPSNQILQIRYEDIINNTKLTIKRITDFLGIEYESEMLNYDKFSHADDIMKLWDGSNAKNCGYHDELARGSISVDTFKDREKLNDEVSKLYASNSTVKYTNRYLGYDTPTSHEIEHASGKLTYCFVFICQGGPLEIKALLLAASLARHMHCNGEIVVAIPSPPEIWKQPSSITLDTLEMMGARFVPIFNNVNNDYPIGNKVSCLSIETTADKTVFLDSDILCMRSFFHENRFHSPVSLRPAGAKTWGGGANDWQDVYDLFDIETPSTRIMTTVTLEESMPYFNAGVIFADTDAGLGRMWTESCRLIDANPEVKDKRPWLDQIALPIAIMRMNLGIDELDNSYNHPGILSTNQADRPPLFLHYHQPSLILKHRRAMQLIGEIINTYPHILSLMRIQTEWQPVVNQYFLQETV